MKKIEQILNLLKNNKYAHYLIIIAVGIIASILLKNIQIYETHDGFIHLLRLIGVSDTLKSGQFPPIIIADYCTTTGYSMTLFYPPFVTFIPLLFKLITPTYAIALKLFGAVCIIFSGITMYNFVYRVTKKRSIALFAAIIYIIAPYKLGNVYKRYAIGEFAALVFMPTLFTGMHNLFEGDGKKHYYIAIGASILTLCHTITTLYAAMFCIIYIIFNIKKLKEKNVIIKIFINLIFILLITMMFYLPMLEAESQAKYTILDDNLMRTTNWFTEDNSIYLSEFFVDIGVENATTYIIGIPMLILFVATIYTYRKVDKKYKNIYIIFLVFSFISLHMSSKYFPWKFMPNVLCKLQYPWRMMGFFDFYASLICGINLYILLKAFTKKDIIRFIVLLILLIISIIYTLGIENQFKYRDPEVDKNYENFVLKDTKLNHMRINRDYLPVKAVRQQDTYMQTRISNTLVLEGYAKIVEHQKEKLTVKMKIEEALEGTVLEFAYLYYPGYTVTIKENDSIKTLNTVESENGYVSVKLPKDLKDAELEVKYEPTNVTKISYGVSIISIIILAIYIVVEKRRNKC